MQSSGGYNLTPQEVKIIAGQADETNTTMYTGMRVGEALALRWVMRI